MEKSSFGSKFVAMKQCCEYLKGLGHKKLRMMGIPVNNPCFVHGDNLSVLWNTSIPDSMLKKKTAIISYHFVCGWFYFIFIPRLKMRTWQDKYLIYLGHHYNSYLEGSIKRIRIIMIYRYIFYTLIIHLKKKLCAQFDIGP